MRDFLCYAVGLSSVAPGCTFSVALAERKYATVVRVTLSYPKTEPKVTASDDQADVEKVLAGEVSAFEGIVRRWQGPLINLAYRFCHDRARAEEMAQEAFLRAYRG